jgi:glycosyltransferase involved in cell wall biosynthesis
VEDHGMTPRCPLLFFADDWGRHPSSAQHLVRHLLEQHDVYWINTIGTRKPRLDFGTVRRGLEKLRHWTRAGTAGETRPAGLQVRNPAMWPWIGSRWSRWLNRQLLLRDLLPLVQTLPEPPVVVTTVPIVADLIGRLPAARWVYYCVDDFTQWPGLDGGALRTLEDRLVAQADVLIAVSDTLRDRLAAMGRGSWLLTHGVDLDFWKPDGLQKAFMDFRSMPRPRAVFWGVIDRRLDVGMVRRLAADLEGGTVILVGPQDNPDTALLALDRVVLQPAVPFGRLPALACAADVLVMPYADLPVTRAIQPLKLKEYLATGKPVVVSDLPANRVWADCLDLAATPAEFSRRVRQRLAEGVTESQKQARARLALESWAEKARCFAEWALPESAIKNHEAALERQGPADTGPESRISRLKMEGRDQESGSLPFER